MRLLQACAAFVSGAAVLIGVGSASADSYRINLSAHVPTSCSVGLGTAIVEVPGGFRLGEVSRSCNTRYQLSLSHVPLAGAEFGFQGRTIPAAGGVTILDSMAAPTKSSAELFVFGVDRAAAEQIAASAQLSVAPVGV